MSIEDPLAEWFDKYYFSQKGIKWTTELTQSIRFAKIAGSFQGLTPCEAGFGREANLRGLLTEIASTSILDLLTRPAFHARISTNKEDRWGADMIVSNGDPDITCLGIDTKVGKGGKPRISQPLKAPILKFLIPCEEWGMRTWIEQMQQGNIRDPDEYVEDVGIEGFRQSGLIPTLQYQAGWIITHDVIRYRARNPAAVRFLDTILEL